MSVFSVKANGHKFSVVAANVLSVQNSDEGKAYITFVDGSFLRTEVSYDSVRKNLVKALGKAVADQE